MPKAKKGKGKATTKVEEPQEPQKARMVPAVRKLLDSDKKAEIWRACIDVAALALEHESIVPLTACGAVAGMVKHVRNESAQVRVSAVRGLRNLILTGGADVAASVVEQCPAAALCGLWKDTADLLAKMQAAPEGKKKKKNPAADAAMQIVDETGKEGDYEAYFVNDETVDTVGHAFVDVTLLIGSLAFLNEGLAAQLSGNADLLSALIDCIHVHAVTSNGSTLAVAAADLLLLLCEDNAMAQHTVRSQVSKDRQAAIARLALEPATTPNHTLAKVTALGLLAALDPSQLPQVCQQLLQHGLAITPLADYENTRQLIAKADKPELKKVAMEQYQTKLKTLKAALEISVNVVCSADTSDKIEDDEEAFRRTAVGNMVIQSGFGGIVAAKAAELLGQAPSAATEEALRDPLSETTDAEVQSAFGEVESAVVVLLMNLILVLPLKSLGSPEALWTLLQNVFARDAALADRLVKKDDRSASHPQEALVLTRLANLCNILWAVLRKDEAEGTGLDLEAPFLTSLVTFIGTRRMNPRAARNEELVVNTLQFCSEARAFFETDGGGAQDTVIQLTGQLCMDCLKDASLAVNVEAGNTVIDVFSDDQWDGVLKALNLTQHLFTFGGFLDEKLKLLRSTNAPVIEEVEAKLDIVESNLGPFIKYKQGRGM